MTTTTTPAPDLTVRPPRSPRVRLGGFVILPRAIDKGRATIAGKNGEYHYACPLDQLFFDAVGIDSEAFKTEIAKGKGDGELLEWILQNGTKKMTPFEIKSWSDFVAQRGPNNVKRLTYFLETITKLAPHREDICTIFDLLDLDDFVSYGGKA